VRNPDCPLCISARKLQDNDAGVLYKDSLIMVTPFRRKMVPGFIVVMPLRCVASVEDLTPEESGSLFQAAGGFTKIIKEELRPQRVYWTVFNEDPRHVNLWLLPRYDEMLTWGMTQEKADHCHAHVLLYNLFEGRKSYPACEVDDATMKLKSRGMQLLPENRK
jgi:diadenosine tetraphosphate (Ap4A) HIT family hydrolase